MENLYNFTNAVSVIIPKCARINSYVPTKIINRYVYIKITQPLALITHMQRTEYKNFHDCYKTLKL